MDLPGCSGNGTRCLKSSPSMDGRAFAEEQQSMDSETIPARWSRIPFGILQNWETDEKRRCSTLRYTRTSIEDLPEPILAVIFTLISDTRTRNAMALVCTNWYSLERATRTSLCLRGNISDLFLIPRSFQAVEQLDLSQCSPWGYSLFQSTPERALLVGHVLKHAFPNIRHMTVYVRDARDIEIMACFWPELMSIKLVRWHQRPTQPEESSGYGMEFRFLMQCCKSLRHLDLSHFYCWTEDIPPALQIEPSVSLNLRCLNLLKVSEEGFKASELDAIAKVCLNLEELQIVLVFDPRFLDFVGDDALLQLAANCNKLRVLHLIDSFACDNVRGDPTDGFVAQDAQLGRQGLVGAFEALPLLEDLAIVLSHNVRDAGPALETLASHCKRLRSLQLGHFHGVCRGPQPDGIALCSGLKNLVIKNSADLNDMGMIAIATGCTNLCKLGLQSCKEVSKVGLQILTRQLTRTLLDVEVSCCMLMNTVDTLWALQPIQATIQRLHVDCLWDADLVARESEGSHEPRRLSTLNLMEFTAVKDDVGPSSTATKAASETRSLLVGATEVEDGGRDNRIGHDFDLNLSLLSSQADSSENAKAGKLMAGSDDGWHALSSNVSVESIREKRSVNSVTNQCSLLIHGSSGALGAELVGAGSSEGLGCGSNNDVVTPSEQHAASQEEFGNELKCTKSWDVKLDSFGTISATENGNPETLGKAGSIPRHNSPGHESFLSELEGPKEASPLAESSLSFREEVWSKLKSLSLWIHVGELLSPLPSMGLQLCPSLQEVHLKVEGDSRLCPKPNTRFSGVATFVRYPAMSKLVLDCSEIVGYALSAPKGHMELSLWERWYLQGIETMNLSELDYWPPQDRDANRRKLSLPGAGLISQCSSLRKLRLHGTINEHFLRMFLNIPKLRDVQLRTDYYPAPDIDLNTEMRADACKRFEAALSERGFPD